MNMSTEAVAGTVAATAVGVVGGVHDVTLPGFGVPLITVAMSAAGALISFAHGASITGRATLFRMAAANTLIGLAATVLLPAAFGWKWVDTSMQPPLAFIFALAARWLVPLAIDIAPAAIKGLLSKFLGVTVNTPEKGNDDHQ